LALGPVRWSRAPSAPGRKDHGNGEAGGDLGPEGSWPRRYCFLAFLLSPQCSESMFLNPRCTEMQDSAGSTWLRLLIPLSLLLSGWLFAFLARRNEKRVQAAWEALLKDNAPSPLKTAEKEERHDPYDAIKID
jgi:hypothetical protein